MATPTTTPRLNPFSKSSGYMTPRIRSRMLFHVLFLMLMLTIATVTFVHP